MIERWQSCMAELWAIVKLSPYLIACGNGWMTRWLTGTGNAVNWINPEYELYYRTIFNYIQFYGDRSPGSTQENRLGSFGILSSCFEDICELIQESSEDHLELAEFYLQMGSRVSAEDGWRNDLMLRTPSKLRWITSGHLGGTRYRLFHSNTPGGIR